MNNYCVYKHTSPSNYLNTLCELDMSNTNNVENIFYNSTAIKNLGGFKNLGKSYTQTTVNYSKYKLSVPSSTLYESLLNVARSVYDLNLTYNVNDGGTLYAQAISMGNTNKTKLEATEEGQQALAELALKGWTIS